MGAHLIAASLPVLQEAIRLGIANKSGSAHRRK